MAAVSEWVVREYFESLGYLVMQPRKYLTGGRHKSPEERVDLVVSNPRVREHRLPPNGFVWTGDDFRTVARAVVYCSRYSAWRRSAAESSLSML